MSLKCAIAMTQSSNDTFNNARFCLISFSSSPPAATPAAAPGATHAATPAATDFQKAEINAEIDSQGASIRKLKSEKASKEAIDAEVKILLQLKAKFKSVVGEDWKPAEVPSKGKKQKNGPKDAAVAPAAKATTPEAAASAAADIPEGDKTKEQLKKEAAEKKRLEKLAKFQAKQEKQQKPAGDAGEKKDKKKKDGDKESKEAPVYDSETKAGEMKDVDRFVDDIVKTSSLFPLTRMNGRVHAPSYPLAPLSPKSLLTQQSSARRIRPQIRGSCLVFLVGEERLFQT